MSDPKITKLPPGEAYGARALQEWSSDRLGGRVRWRDKRKANRKQKPPKPVPARPAKKSTPDIRVRQADDGTFGVYVGPDLIQDGLPTSAAAWRVADSLDPKHADMIARELRIKTAFYDR